MEEVVRQQKETEKLRQQQQQNSNQFQAPFLVLGEEREAECVIISKARWPW
jgi:glutaredoxin